MQEIAILIPCHNEEITIGKVIDDFQRVLPDCTIYVCDNASCDRTADIAREKGVVVLSEPRIGKGYAVKKMLREVVADIYIIVDGDDTYKSEDCLKMIELVNKGYDMVIADRLSTDYKKINERKFHNIGNALVVRIINFIFKNDIKDIMSGFRALSSRFVNHVPIESNGFEIETEMSILAFNFDFNITQIPASYNNRPRGSVSKLRTFTDGFKVLNTILKLFIGYRPFFFFSIISIILLLIAVALFIPVFITYVHSGLVPKFPTLIASCSIAIIAILFFMIGLILNSITRHAKFIFNGMLKHSDINRYKK